MAKARKPAPARKHVPAAKKTVARAPEPEPPPIPQVGDKVIPERSESTYLIARVSPDGSEVDFSFPGTNIERFRVKTATLKFVDRVPQTSRPAAKGRSRLHHRGEVRLQPNSSSTGTGRES